MKKPLTIIAIIILLILGAYYIGLGFLPRTDVVVADFEVSEQEDEMTIYTYILSSAGYSRTVKNVSDDPEKMMLKFYSAFGGVNGSIGAKSEFDLPLAPECKEIYVLLYDDYRLTLAKNPLLENGNESNNRLLEKIIS
ncbi:MAG: hypothetical protein UCN50_09070 [Anaerotignum sp.]|uniref:hypothetical protein n=1 Tax=Anaerotignum sp. TaxID=2039241 RepID=UPI002E7A86CB|nr:hypothetical protein [Anaerotignum sp.]MEE0702095.1 hypothetical protein [Anaerotignum sp.]